MRYVPLVVCAALAVTAAFVPPPADMASAANALLASLDRDQLARVQWPFDSEERFSWHFVPQERQGLPLKQMNERQRAAAFTLLRTGLSEKGYAKAETIRSLELVLREMEQGSARRDPELYYVTIFGKPAPRGAWGWRYEGHHVSQNWTVIDGRPVATTPAFFGANPAEVRTGPRKGTRALAAEEDLGRALLASLDAGQRKQAVTDATAPGEIVTSNARKAAILEDSGIPARALTETQRGVLMSLIEEYASSQPPEQAAARLAKVRAEGLADVRFAWMGSIEKGPGIGNYYRIQGKSFLIEYDNTQNDANHVHTVWRDFEGDFGVDVLAQHYARFPHDAGR